MQFNGIRGKSFKIQEQDTLLELKYDASSNKVSGAYISKDNGTTFEKLLDETEVTNKVRELISSISSGLQTPINLGLESDLPDISSTTIWNPGTSYIVDNLVLYGHTVYKCITANNDTDFDVSKWAEICKDGTYYSIQKMDITKPTSTGRAWYNSSEDINKWQVIYDDEGFATVEYSTITTGEIIPKDAVITNNNIIYRCKADTTCSTNWSTDSVNFEELKVSGSILNPFEPNKYYTENEMVIENNIIYTRKTAGTSLATLGADIANWEAQVHLHTSGNRHVLFKTTSTSYNGTVTNGWRTIKDLAYIDGDFSMIDTSTSKLVVPVDGLYYLIFQGGIMIDSGSASQIDVLASASGRVAYGNHSNTSNLPTVCSIKHLTAGETISFKHNGNANYNQLINSVSEFGLLAEDKSDSLIAESTMVAYTTSAKGTWTNLAQENITNPSVIGTDGSITLPEDGMYIVNLTTGISTSGGVNGRIQTRLVDANDNIIHFGSQTECYNTQIQGFTHLVSGKQGDIFYIKCYKDVAQSGLVWGNKNQISKLSVAKLKSTEITLCSQDLYTEYLQKLPTGITPMDYESWIKTIISQNQMRVKAKIVNQTRAASGIIQHKFTFAEGEESMLSNNTFVAPFSGMYMINVPGLATNASHSTSDAGTTMIVKGTTSNDESLIGFSVANSTVTIPSVSTTCWLNRGEVLSVWWNETSATSRTLLRNDYEAFVEFVLIQSGHPYVNFPNLWTPGVEYDLGNGLYGYRFQAATWTMDSSTGGTIAVLPASLQPKDIVDWGGSITHPNGNRWALPAAMKDGWYEIYRQGTTTTTPYNLQLTGTGGTARDLDVWMKYTK